MSGIEYKLGTGRYRRYTAAVSVNSGSTITWRAVDVNGNIEPRLAESVTGSDDSVTWTIKLRDGLTFTDGTPLDAAAVIYNWDRFANPDTGGRCVGDASGRHREGWRVRRSGRQGALHFRARYHAGKIHVQRPVRRRVAPARGCR